MASIQPLVRFLENRDAISAIEVKALESLPLDCRALGKGEEIVGQGARPVRSCLILKGFAARTFITPEGRRQVTAVHIAGDFVDLHSLLLKKMDHAVVAMSPVNAAFVAHTDLLKLISGHPHLGRLLWLSTVIDAAIQRAWIASLGRRSSANHMGHLLCEMFARLQSQGLTNGNTFDFPITQADLSDMLGLSTVHVNRTLQELRRTGLVKWEAPRVTLPDFEALAELVDFDPTYLNIWREPR
jgi:CRP-like cAMP-binding protein